MRKILLSCFLVALYFSAWAQERTVSGTVTASEDASPLPGVNVLVKGTSSGSVTDAEGQYSLSIPGEGPTTLVFSFIGLKSIEVDVGERSVVNVQMAEDLTQLTEVVVTALGLEREERKLGYATTTVSAQDITQAAAVSPMNGLQGKVAGVQITTASGAPGASTKAIVRGYASVGGNNNALYVVDGVPINNSSSNFYDGGGLNDAVRTLDFGNRANDINPNDIESITFLKGAAATALYGSRAGNGAIMITTKKGARNSFKVSYTGSVEMTEPLRLPQLQGTFGQGWSGHFAFDENGSWGPVMDGEERLWGNVVDNAQKIKTFENRASNLADFYERGLAFNNSISVSGGKENSTFFFSYSNSTMDGVVPTDADKLDRNTFALRGSLHGEKLSISSSVNYVSKKVNTIASGQGSSSGGATLFQELVQIPRDFSIVDLANYKDKFNNLNNFYTPYADNPYFVLNENGNNYLEDRVFGKLELNYDLLTALSLKARFGGDIAAGHLKDYGAIARTDPGSTNNLRGRSDVVGRVDEWDRRAAEWNLDLIADFHKQVGDLSLNVLGGFHSEQRSSFTGHSYITTLDLPGYYNLSNSSAPAVATLTESLRRLYGIYGQAEIGYKDYLFLNLIARNDWSSTLPTDNSAFFYPGVNISYIITDHLDIPMQVLDFARVRASWGKTGNDADPYSIRSVYIPSTVNLPFGNVQFPVAGVNAFEVSNQIGNPALKPEISSEYEFGLNVGLLDSRVSLDVAYYTKKTSGQILAVPLAPSTGYTTQVLNFGEIQNQGVEIGMGLTPIKNLSGLSWDIFLAYTKNNNKVLELRDDLDQVVLNSAYDVNFIAKVGQPLGVYEGPVAKLDPLGRTVVNATGIPVSDPVNQEYGVAQYDYTLGVTNTLKYKNISLSAVLDIRQGGVFYSYTSQLTYFVGNATRSTYNMRQPFLEPNSVMEVESDDGVGYVENTTPIDMGSINSYWYSNSHSAFYRNSVLDRSFVKLREVVLSYQLPAIMVEKTPFKNISASLYGRNLLLWTPKENNFVDPETTTWGNDLDSELGEFAAGPTLRAYGFSLRLGI